MFSHICFIKQPRLCSDEARMKNRDDCEAWSDQLKVKIWSPLLLVCSFAWVIANSGGCLLTCTDDEEWVRSLAPRLDSAQLTMSFRTPTRTSESHLKKGTLSMHMHHTLRVWVENKRLLLHYALAFNHMHTHAHVWITCRVRNIGTKCTQLLWLGSVRWSESPSWGPF